MPLPYALALSIHLCGARGGSASIDEYVYILESLQPVGWMDKGCSLATSELANFSLVSQTMRLSKVCEYSRLEIDCIHLTAGSIKIAWTCAITICY